MSMKMEWHSNIVLRNVLWSVSCVAGSSPAEARFLVLQQGFTLLVVFLGSLGYLGVTWAVVDRRSPPKRVDELDQQDPAVQIPFWFVKSGPGGSWQMPRDRCWRLPETMNRVFFSRTWSLLLFSARCFAPRRKLCSAMICGVWLEWPKLVQRPRNIDLGWQPL